MLGNSRQAAPANWMCAYIIDTRQNVPGRLKLTTPLSGSAARVNLFAKPPATNPLIMNYSPSSSAIPEPLRQSAVVLPSFGVYDSSDILTPSDINHNDSPSPLGIVLVGYNEHGCGKILPLYYVSAKAAHQRSPASNPLNGEGVKPGWYTAANPSMHYAVRYVSNNNLIKRTPLIKSPTDKCFRADLTIDGTYVGGRVLCLTKTYKLEKKNGWDGFSRGITKNRWGLTQSISQFQFAKLGASHSDHSDQTPSENVAPENFGTIRVGLDVGDAKSKNHSQKAKHDFYNSSMDSVGEKVIAKRGISMKTEAGRSTQINVPLYCEFVISRAMPELTVDIYVREKTWLQSRNILDDAGNACSCDAFLKRRSAQAPRTAPTAAIDLTDEPIKLEKKEVKPIIKDEVDLTLDIKPNIKDEVDVNLDIKPNIKDEVDLTLDVKPIIKDEVVITLE